LPEGEINPLREAGAETVKRINPLPELQKLFRECLSVMTKNQSFQLVRIEWGLQIADNRANHLRSDVLHAADFSTELFLG
jgi:hypothetical protein